MSDDATKPAAPAARRLWRADVDRALTAAERIAQTAAVYAAQADPWQLSREHARFAATNAIIASRFGRVGRLIEIGCGEGYQSAWLAQLCAHLVGVDISEAALERARRLVPTATFLISPMPELPLPPEQARFDLAVACEVLYESDDIGATIARMRGLAPRGLVTGLASKWRRFGPAIADLPGLAEDGFEADGHSYRVVSWSEA